MKDVAKMRLGLLRELKKLKVFFEDMERGVKSRDPARIYPAYVFIKTLAHHMSEADLTPLSLELHQALLHDYYKETLECHESDQ